jgi:hypothetical protein
MHKSNVIQAIANLAHNHLLPGKIFKAEGWAFSSVEACLETYAELCWHVILNLVVGATRFKEREGQRECQELPSEVGITKFFFESANPLILFWSPLNANPLIFIWSPLNANPLIFQE